MGRMGSPAKTLETETDDWASAAEARVLDAALALAPAQGWTWASAYAAGRSAGFTAGETELLLPGGPRDLAALHSRRCDCRALETLAGVDPGALKVRERIRRGTLAWLDAAMVDKPSTRRWAGFLALPTNVGLGLRLAWETADAIWRWAGDKATDENHYTKRALLASILVSALMVRLASGAAAAEAHLDRRIEGVMRFERLKGRLSGLRLGARAAGALGRLRYR
jgi:ubiquinone biosynthesis protein COQ9